MGFLTRVKEAFGLEARTDLSPTDPSWVALSYTNGAAAAVSARQAENLSAVLACTNAIATALAYVPVWIYRREPDGTRREVPDHPIMRLVRGGANGGMTWPEFVEHFVASTLLTGNGLAEVERANNGRVTGLRWVPWQNVSVEQLRSGRLAYDVYDGRSNRRLLEGEVIHLRDRTDDGILGRSRISRANETVSGVRSADEFARSYLGNGANPSGVITSDGMMNEEQVAQLRAQLAEKAQGASNSGKPLVLTQGLQWKQSSLSPEDSELLESRKFGIIEICRLFQVPPPIVQAYENNTFTNAAQAGLWFATFCLTPWARRIEAEFARSVFPAGSNLEMEMDLSGFLRGDPETRWNAHKIAIDTGVLDADEVRQIEGWNPRGANG